MPHTIWTGSISFGLVNIPVGLYSATTDHTIHFHQFQAGTSDRVRNHRVNERTGNEVAYKEIVKGYDLGDGSFVIVEPGELEEIAPKRSSNIEITDFVDLAEIDPILFRSAYYLGPKSPEAKKAYGLLHRALAETGKVGVSSFVMRGKEYLCVVRADRDVLVLETLYFADEIRDPKYIFEGADELEEPKERELKMAIQLVESLASPWKVDAYRDTYLEQVESLIERKRKGESIVSNEGESDAGVAPVIDLMTALQESVQEVKRAGAAKRGDGVAGKKTPSTRPPRPKAGGGDKRPSRSTRSASGKAPTAKAPARKAPARKKAS